MTNKEKALALINTFATGDTAAAKELLADGYIQHNLASLVHHFENNCE